MRRTLRRVRPSSYITERSKGLAEIGVSQLHIRNLNGLLVNPELPNLGRGPGPTGQQLDNAIMYWK